MSAAGAAGAVVAGGDAASAWAGRTEDGTGAADSGLRLWYPDPAADWLEALPIGNGRLGAMVFGGTDREQLQLNEDTVWAGGPYDQANPEGLSHLEEIRRRVFAEYWAGAQELIDAEFMGIPRGQLMYQTVGSLRLTFPSGGAVSEYRRDLDLETAVASVRYRRDGVAHSREVFASHPDQVIVMRLTVDQPGALSFTAAFDSPQEVTASSPDPLTIGIDGTTQTREGITGRVRFRSLLRVRATGGTVSSADGILTVSGADTVVLFISIGTSHNSWQDASGDHAARAVGPLRSVANQEYQELEERHIADYRRLFRRTALDLGTTAAAALPTDERVVNFATTDDPALVALYFQYGRYLLISSSRPGTQPANLQGIWNDSLSPPWDSKYTININTQMNYWPAAPTNLLECWEPIFALLADLSVSGARTARTQYGAKGWVTHHNTDLWRGTAPVDAAFYGMWQTGGAWLTTSIWQHYLFTGDKDRFRERYPILKDCVRFFLDTLVRDPDSGHLVTCPSNSPEHAHHGDPDQSVCAGPTMDNQILRDLFDALDKASTELGVDADLRRQVRAARDQLPPMRIGAQGQVQEWQKDWDAISPDQHHRHISHLYGLHPSNQITKRGTPELYDAALVTLAQRGDDGTGWSLAWKINFWARLEDGARSHKLLTDQLTTTHTAPNLFDLHPPFQIDGNFGATSGISEWLLHSHSEELHLLPALPPRIPEGRVTGLLARGGFEVDITWAGGTLDTALIRSRTGTRATVRTTVPVTVTAHGRPVATSCPHSGVYVFDTRPRTTYRLHATRR